MARNELRIWREVSDVYGAQSELRRSMSCIYGARMSAIDEHSKRKRVSR